MNTHRTKYKFYTIYLILGLITGVAIAHITRVYAMPIYESLLVSFGSFLLGYILHCIGHELGHCIGGWMTGFRLVFFRVGPFGIIRDRNGFRFTKGALNSSQSECLMISKEHQHEPFYPTGYLWGGIIFNVLSLGVLSFLVFKFEGFPITTLVCIAMIFSGLIVIAMHGFAIEGIYNDAYFIRLFHDNPNAVNLSQVLLKALEAYAQGETLENVNLDAVWHDGSRDIIAVSVSLLSIFNCDDQTQLDVYETLLSGDLPLFLRAVIALRLQCLYWQHGIEHQIDGLDYFESLTAKRPIEIFYRFNRAMYVNKDYHEAESLRFEFDIVFKHFPLGGLLISYQETMNAILK